MLIDFTQIYSEPGANFGLSGMLLGAIADELNALERNIEPLSNKFKNGKFELVLIISAKKNTEFLEVVGPNIRHKAQEVEFSLFIPWRETSTFTEKVRYVLPMIFDGVCNIFARFNVDVNGVEGAINNVLKSASTHPQAFQYAKS